MFTILIFLLHKDLRCLLSSLMPASRFFKKDFIQFVISGKDCLKNLVCPYEKWMFQYFLLLSSFTDKELNNVHTSNKWKVERKWHVYSTRLSRSVMFDYFAITDIYKKERKKGNICQELYSYNSVQLIFIKPLSCAEHPIKQWEAMINTQVAQIEPSQLSI